MKSPTLLTVSVDICWPKGNCLKRCSLVAVLGVLLPGCQMPQTPQVTPPAKSDSTTGSGSETPKNSGANTGDATSGSQSATQAKPGDNPYRIYQLRDLKKTSISIGRHDFQVWVMDTTDKDREGMMWLEDKDVKDDEGMIFPSDLAKPQNFWMQNTEIPLDIVFISSGKKVLNILLGKPLDETTQLKSKGDALYVVELKGDTCKRLGIEAGATVTIPASVKAVR